MVNFFLSTSITKLDVNVMITSAHFYRVTPIKVPLRRKFIGLFPPNSVAEYRVLFIFPQKTEQQTFHPNIF